jgi:hypothetical protein
MSNDNKQKNENGSSISQESFRESNRTTFNNSRSLPTTATSTPMPPVKPPKSDDKK